MKIKNYISIGILSIITLLIFCNCNKGDDFLADGDAFVDAVIGNVEGITVQEAKEMMDTAEFYVLIDVREPNEHHPGYIPGSVNIPRGTLEFNMPKEAYWENLSLYPPYKTDLLLVYCKKGKRSILATSTLQKMGYNRVRYIMGGFKKWELTYPNDYERDEIEGGHADEAEEVGGC